MSVEEVSENVTEGAEERKTASGIDALWNEILGGDADVESGFIANGGDSLMAVLLADRVFASTGREIDYLEILDAPDSATLARIVLAADRDR